MNVVKEFEHSLLLNAFGIADKYYLTASVLVFFDLANPSALLKEQELWPAVTDVLGKDVMLDQGMPKPKGEVLAAGSCFAPSGGVRNASHVRFRVGDIRKTVHVFGNRYWIHRGGVVSVITDPEPFKAIPVTYENAFGGTGYDKNPIGKGIDPAVTSSGKTVIPLPNIEDPDHLIGSPSDRPEPAGFAPYPLTWPQRTRKLGTYDDKWLRERWPYYPEDMDHTFFNASPPDQQIKTYFKGDEGIEILNMHPEIQLIQSRLPSVRIRCFMTMADKTVEDKEKTEFREVSTNLDTVWLFPSIMRGIAVFRGTTEVRDDEYSDVIRIFIATEKLKEKPKDLPYYLEEEKKKMAFDMPDTEVSFEDAQKELDAAMKEVAAIPRKVEEAKSRTLGKAPLLPPAKTDMVANATALTSMASNLLAGAEEKLLALKAEYGHLMKIDISPLADARKDLEKMPSHIARASDDAKQAVKKAKDFEKEMKDAAKKDLDPEALKKKGIDPAVLKEKGIGPEMFFADEEDPWHKRGLAFLTECVENLRNSRENMDALLKAGLTSDIIEQAWLGVNPEKQCEEPAEWGFESPGDQPVKIPAGLVIPHFDSATLDRITVRQGDIENATDDFLVKGSEDKLLFLGFGEGKPVVLVPDELEAWLVYQEAWDVCMALALKKLNELEDDDLKKQIEAAPAFLIVCPEEKQQNDTAALDEWLEAFPDAKKVSLPEGKTMLEARKTGWDIRTWIMDNLPEGALPQDVVQAEAKDKERAVKIPRIDVSGMIKKFKKDVTASMAPVLAELETTKKEMMDDALKALKKAGIDPATTSLFAKEPVTAGNPFSSFNFSSDLLKVKEKLRKEGRLTSEIEKKIDDAVADMKQMTARASAQYDEAEVKIAAAEKKAADPLPDWAKKQLKDAGVDVEEGMEPLTREKVVEMYARGDSFAGKDLSGLDLSGLELPGINLSKASLGKADFSKTRLDGADFSSAICGKADFSGASLKSAKMSEGLFMKARFVESNLCGADMQSALLSDADLSGADLSEAKMDDVILESAKLTGARACGASLKSGVFIKTDAAGAYFRDSDLSGASFVEANVEKADFSGSTASSVTFWTVKGKGAVLKGAELSNISIGGGSCFQNADFTDAKMNKINFMGSDLAGCNFQDCSIEGSLLEECNLSGANFYRVSAKETGFNKSNLEGADMRGINLFKGSLRKARLTNTDLRDSNLYGVEFFKTTVGHTRLKGANLKMTHLYKRTDILP